MLKQVLALALIALLPGVSMAYSVSDGAILDESGQTVQLRGVNWFGFETDTHSPHGLWARNWRDMIVQMKGLGFNAVRLPLCPATLHASTPGAIDYSLNPDLQGLDSLQLLDKVVGELDAQGFYILLDHHLPDCQAISELWYTGSYSEQQWIDDLVLMASRYRNVGGVVGIDLKNEPHGAATWGTGNTATDWDLAAARASSAILAQAPNLLIFVEGIQSSSSCSDSSAHFWGENLQPLACTPLGVPSNRLVLSPHTYGPDVYEQPYFSDPTFPANMPAIWETHFGQFVQQGNALVLGEFGGKYGEGDPRDRQWQDALVDYLVGKGVDSGFYWSWNPNSGDTGGILKDDWLSVREDKLELLSRLWGSDGMTEPPPEPDPQPEPEPGVAVLAPEVHTSADWGMGYCVDIYVTNDGSAAVQWVSDYNVDGSIYEIWRAQASALTGLVRFSGTENGGILQPGQTEAFGYCANRDAQPAPEPEPGQILLTAQVQISSDWGSGYCANLQVTNNSGQTAEWVSDHTIEGTIYNLWSANVSANSGAARFSGVDWNRELSNGQSTSFGYCANR